VSRVSGPYPACRVSAYQNRVLIPVDNLIASARVAIGPPASDDDLSRRGGHGNSSLMRRDDAVDVMEKRSEPFLVGRDTTRDCLRSGRGSMPYNVAVTEDGGRSFSIDWSVDGDSE